MPARAAEVFEDAEGEGEPEGLSLSGDLVASPSRLVPIGRRHSVPQRERDAGKGACSVKHYIVDRDGDFGMQSKAEANKPISGSRKPEDYDVGLTNIYDATGFEGKADAILLSQKLELRWPEFRPFRLVGVAWDGMQAFQKSASRIDTGRLRKRGVR